MSEQDYSKITGNLGRLRDVYRVHESTGKQKKQKRSTDEKDFMEELEESEKNMEGYDHQSHGEKPKQQHHAGSLLNILHAGTAPVFIEELKEDVEDKKKE